MLWTFGSLEMLPSHFNTKTVYGGESCLSVFIQLPNSVRHTARNRAADCPEQTLRWDTVCDVCGEWRWTNQTHTFRLTAFTEIKLLHCKTSQWRCLGSCRVNKLACICAVRNLHSWDLLNVRYTVCDTNTQACSLSPYMFFFLQLFSLFSM